VPTFNNWKEWNNLQGWSRTAISYHQTQSPDEKTTSIASYPNSPPNENPVHSKAHCRHLSLNHDNKPPRYNSQDRNLDLPPRQPFPAAYKLTLTSHRNTGHQQHHAQQKHRATKAASDAKARAPPPMKYAADYRHWIRFASLSAVSGSGLLTWLPYLSADKRRVETIDRYGSGDGLRPGSGCQAVRCAPRGARPDLSTCQTPNRTRFVTILHLQAPPVSIRSGWLRCPRCRPLSDGLRHWLLSVASSGV
jgi:hypothetical protein